MSEEDKSDTEPILIKKYPNRRLYNTKTSTYIILDDIVALIKSDTPFIIQDKKTGDDITRSILNQIIFERETENQHYHFPLEVQKQLIGMYDDTYSSMFPDYLKQSLNLFEREREQMKETMQAVLGKNTETMMAFSQNLANQNFELFKKSLEMFSGLPATTDKDAAKGVDHQQESKTSDQESESIQDRIDALQERLSKLE